MKSITDSGRMLVLTHLAVFVGGKLVGGGGSHSSAFGWSICPVESSGARKLDALCEIICEAPSKVKTMCF